MGCSESSPEPRPGSSPADFKRLHALRVEDAEVLERDALVYIERTKGDYRRYAMRKLYTSMVALDDATDYAQTLYQLGLLLDFRNLLERLEKTQTFKSTCVVCGLQHFEYTLRWHGREPIPPEEDDGQWVPVEEKKEVWYYGKTWEGHAVFGDGITPYKEPPPELAPRVHLHKCEGVVYLPGYFEAKRYARESAESVEVASMHSVDDA